jgi:Putative abortive phage resistance protein AbiGi, antitoxin
MPSSPGTVSKILWHFAGGPRWNNEMNRQEDKPKPIEEAYAALIGILKSRELRIGQYKEVVNVIVPHLRIRDPETDKMVMHYNVMKTLISAPVCCLADIPIMHLNYHADRYGKIAIGFHRDVTIRAGFGPVFYQRHNSAVLQAIYYGFAELDEASTLDLEYEANNLGDEIDQLECEDGHKIDGDGSSMVFDLASEANVMESAVKAASESFDKFLAFVKTFEPNEFGTIYCEREWRSIQPFKFDYSDVSMIVLPRNTYIGDHYDNFVEEARRLQIPLNISIVAWDDLVEH